MAKASAGEFVQRVAAVRRYGRTFMRRLNALRAAAAAAGPVS